MAKFIATEDIPADMHAVAFWQDSHGNTQWQMSKSIRGAKVVAAKHKDAPEYGWTVITDSDRKHGLMIW